MFALEDGVVYRTFALNARGLNALRSVCQWLERAPLGRNEGEISWFRPTGRRATGRRRQTAAAP